MATDIEQVQTALVEFDKVGAGLAQLKKNYAGMLYDVETPNGMELAKASRQVLRQPRYAIERIRKEAKAPLLAIGKKLDDEAKRITAEIMALEDPIDQQIKTEENRRDREREAAIAAEAKRVSDIQARIEQIRQMPVRASGKASMQVAALQAEAAALVVDASFAEFAEQAASALAQTVAALTGLHAGAVAVEAEAARIILERAELERLRAEQARRDEEVRARQAEADRLAQVERDRVHAEQQAALQVERDKLAAEKAEQDRVAQVERDRVAAERAEQERVAQVERDRIAAEDRKRREDAAREQAKLDADREQLRRDQEALRPAPVAEPAPVAPSPVIGRPSDEQIAAVVAEYFHVLPAVACLWLADFGMDKAA